MEDIEDIYKKYANLIKNYIFNITGDINLAEEVMQETFMIAITQISKFKGNCEISTWLCSIAKKVLYKKTKKDNLRKSISIEELTLEDPQQVEEKYIDNESKFKLYVALQELDINTREVMYLRLMGDLSFKEIGKILNKSENWARTTFFRGKQKIRKEDIL